MGILWACLSGQAALAGVRIDLNGDWRFRIDPQSRFSNYDPAVRLRDPAWRGGGRLVAAPHTWNLGRDDDFNGVGWYFRDFILSATNHSQHVELNFGATFYKSRVWVNGEEVGGHEGGHTAYALDVTQVVRPGANHIAVAVDNRPGPATIPGYAMRLAASGSVWYDWWPNGGLVRSVWLSLDEGGLVRRQSLRSDIKTRETGASSATVRDQVFVENISPEDHTYSISATAYAPDGGVAARGTQSLSLVRGTRGVAEVALEIADPKLWNIGAGQLYQIVAELRDETGRVLASRSDSYGLRTVTIKDRKLYVNGRPVRLSGVSRHEDSPWEGLAESAGTIRHDWADLEALHVTLTRPVHYPQDPAVFDAADRAGILLIPEIPVWQMSEAQLKDPRLVALAKQMMGEMIAQAGDHPSIFAWSICNESDASTPGGEAYVKTMKAWINAIDPGRFVSFADADVSAKPWKSAPALAQADFIMANAYFGTWSGAAGDVEPWLDHLERAYPDKLVIISEFGWPGPFSPDPQAADKARIENFQAQMAAFAMRDFIGGVIFWTYQDYKSSRNLWPGQVEGYVDHGLVDENRQRKPSYAAWEARNRAVSVQAAWSMGDKGLEGFKATLMPNAPGVLPSYPLIGYSARWRVVSAGGEVLAHGEAPLALGRSVAVADRWAAKADLNGAALTLDVLTPDGTRAGGAALDYCPLRLGFAPFSPDQPAREAKP